MLSAVGFLSFSLLGYQLGACEDTLGQIAAHTFSSPQPVQYSTFIEGKMLSKKPPLTLEEFLKTHTVSFTEDGIPFVHTIGQKTLFKKKFGSFTPHITHGI